MSKVEEYSNKFKKSIYRFPIAYVMLLSSVVLQIVYVATSSNAINADNTVLFSNLIFFTYISYMGLVSVRLLREKTKFNEIQSICIYLGLLVATFSLTIFVVPNNLERYWNELDSIKITLVNIAFLLMPLILPSLFSRKDNDDKYWKNVGKIIKPGATAFILSLALFLGLVVAMGAARYLLNAQFSSELIAYISIFCFNIFGSFIYLSGLPQNLSKEFQIKDVSKLSLKVSKYVWIPLVIVYTIILYMFLLRFVFNDDIPANQGVPFVSIYFLFGFYNVYSLFPLQGKAKFDWVRKYILVFALSSIPLLALYFIAIVIRIDAFGFTINRIYVVTVGFAFAFMIMQTILKKFIHLRFVIGGILAMFILITFTPFINVDEISKYSQARIFRNELVKYDLLDSNGKINEDQTLVTSDKMESSFQYLADSDNLDSIKDLFSNSQYDKLETSLYYNRYFYWSNFRDLFENERAQESYNYEDDSPAVPDYTYINSKQSEEVLVLEPNTNQQIIIDLSIWGEYSDISNFIVADEEYYVNTSIEEEALIVKISVNGSTDIVEFPIEIAEFDETVSYDQSDLTFESSSNLGSELKNVTLYITNIEGVTRTNNEEKIHEIRGYLVIEI